MTSITNWSVDAVPSTHPDARALLPGYVEDLSRRYYGRPVTERELEEALAAHLREELTPPDGAVLLARDQDGRARGSTGVRLLAPGVAELKRVYVTEEGRGRGCGGRLLAAAEDWAREHGASLLRLDTRSDLVEARALYARHGFAEVEPYNDNPYAQHWYEKRLGNR
ncbi:GNAT family N-acetyltransferase [Streptomyces sp. TR06-5]|uniref:GNAT family N-acetyltransferase n=1 Tax=unclassified Streptomyces TaxID=2593676 RepID=UPI0039A14831